MGYLGLWIEYMKKAIKQWNEYRIDFIFISVASIIAICLSVANIEIIFTQVDNILGWTKYEVIWILGFFTLVQCIFNTFFINCFDVGSWVCSGNLDILRTRPRSEIFQLLFTERYNVEFPIDQLVMGIVLLIWSDMKLQLSWTVGKCLYFIGATVISTIIYTCIVFIISAMSLWSVKSNYFVEFIFELEEVNQYPLNVYGTGITFLLTYIIPIGFVSFYPSQYILGKEEYYKYAFFSPIVAIVLLVVTVLVWNFGIRHYQSPNS